MKIAVGDSADHGLNRQPRTRPADRVFPPVSGPGRPAWRHRLVSSGAVTDRDNAVGWNGAADDDHDASRERLLTMIRERAVVRGPVVLTSGQHADWYVDLRRILLDGDAAPLAGRVRLAATADLSYDAAGGLTLGADPVATAMLHAAAAQGRKLDAFVVRKAEKAHGLQRRIEGPDVAGRRVLAVEDTSTTGGSVLTAVDALLADGAQIAGVAVLVDRGARAAITARGLAYRAAFELADLGVS
jgi:orotate phosphoribosyltransferase